MAKKIRASIVLTTALIVCLTQWPARASETILARTGTAAPATIKSKVIKPKITAQKKPSKKVLAKTGTTSATKSKAVTRKKTRTIARRTPRRVRPAPVGKIPTYGVPSLDDDPSRDDPIVRAAAIEALGKLMGAVVVVNPENGQILSIVNQKLALESGYQPCSAFKPAVALAALGDGIINSETNRLKLGRKWYLTLEQALAKSNNLYFEELGRSLGIERLQYYGKLFGFGEAASFGINPESQGAFPEKAPSKGAGGVGKVASFGQGISMTTLQLASFTSAMANGGRLYYLQYPTAGEEFVPMLKRELPISETIDSVRKGMESAVLAGTARRANIPDIHILGKTGTCSQDGARLGWFAGYSDSPAKLAVVVLLRTGVKLGGGPKASEVAGRMFRKLGEGDYFASLVQKTRTARILPAAITFPSIQ